MFSISLNSYDFRCLLNDDEKKRYDSMLDYFFDHHYTEDYSVDELMFKWGKQAYPAKYAQFIRQQDMRQSGVELDVKQRVELELLELTEKLTKLRQTIFQTPNELIKKLSNSAMQHLCRQEQAMTQYQSILEARLKEMI